MKALIVYFFMKQKKSGRRNWWDDDVAESFSSSLKKESIRKRIYKTGDLVTCSVLRCDTTYFDASHLGGVSPEVFEQASL